MTSLELAVIGNCQIAALLDSRARIVWFCVPHLDGDPVFCSLLAGTEDPQMGFYDVEIDGYVNSTQRYVPNTAIVETTLYDRQGGAVRVIDFAPRFAQFGRIYRPVMLARRVEAVSGNPRIRVRLRPTGNYGERMCEKTFGSNHIRFVATDNTLRLTTDASISHVLEENFFVVKHPVTLLLGPDETVSDSIEKVGLRFLDETRWYWQDWVQTLAIPFEWQDAVIRAAVTLKLCTFEDTGAVIAAMTTSIPEAANSGRNWDYRYCWLRDAYFVILALNRLGATRTMERFLHYIIDVAAGAEGHRLQPVYGITGRAALEERIIEHLPGYRSMGPVRVGNQAYVQDQHDVYGAVVASATQAFFDERLSKPGNSSLYHKLEQLGDQATQLYDRPDAGLWEYRGRKSVHTFSSVMCWSACDRLAKIAGKLGLPERARHWRAEAEKIRTVIEQRAWDPKQQAYTGSFGNPQLDASLLLLHELGFLSAEDPRFLGTIAAIERGLRRGKHMFRYRTTDDFGEPENAFNICTFWYIDALAACGRREEARELFENKLACRNPMGMLSEDIDPTTQELWGNFPQTYSMVGIINAATRLSKPWRDAF